MFGDLIELVVPGAGWLALGVVVGTAFGDRLRPVAKQAIKIGLTVAERFQEATAEAYERGQDLVAEARHERANSSAKKPRPAQPAARRRARA
jgi:Protein of unknown function (DUF5132)